MTCPICKTDDCKLIPNSESSYYYCECIRCGKYFITPEAEVDYCHDLDERERASISYWLRQNKNSNNPPVLKSADIAALKVSCELPNPQEQIENIIYWIGQKQKTLSFPVAGKPLALLSVFGCVNYSDFRYLVKHMKEINLILDAGISESGMKLILTMSGWEKYEKLRKTNINSKLAFMAMQFNNAELDEILRTVIKPAVLETGFELRRLDEKPEAGLIDDRLRVEIRRSKFLVADLTHENKGAYWEAGFAEGLGLKVIYICEKSVFENPKTKPHFDTDHHLTLKWENTPEGLQEFSEELKAVIRNTFPNEAKMND